MRFHAIPATLIAIALTTTGALAGDWHPPRHHAPQEALVITETYERTQVHVRFAPVVVQQRDLCKDYKHAIWVHGQPIVRDREICVWPDGTLRDGPRPY